MNQQKIIILAGSAGSYSILVETLKCLPADMSVPVIVILHRNAKYETNIESSLSKKCKIEVKIAEDKEHIQAGVAYFAPPGYHLLVEPDYTFSLDSSEPVQFCRPSIDVTMESAADVYQSATFGFLFSGANQDGADGLAYIKKMNGTCIVQNPAIAEISTMPESAIKLGAYHHIMDNKGIIDFILDLHKQNIKN
ncbi:chemotaxis protein CheB [Sphingobacterium spiritivorum]|uniref:chemotaxis protein CheB n=1 Tax=Sphingobacterium spiritivorum TaxID=258 RepID=UPI0019195F08|nr:chemotaxis protein CheB [Sphingobacterium spiritivorum]QQT24242.1 chemotaxis protein CheB [Sphingobacterium spiritivorum]